MPISMMYVFDGALVAVDFSNGVVDVEVAVGIGVAVGVGWFITMHDASNKESNKISFFKAFLFCCYIQCPFSNGVDNENKRRMIKNDCSCVGRNLVD